MMVITIIIILITIIMVVKIIIMLTMIRRLGEGMLNIDLCVAENAQTMGNAILQDLTRYFGSG